MIHTKSKYYQSIRTRLNLISLVLLCLFLFHKNVNAQSDADGTVTNQYWLDYNPSFNISEKLHFNGSIGGRSISPHAWDRLWLRPTVRYLRPKRMLKDVGYVEYLYGGIDMYFTDNIGGVNRLEITPFQAYSLTIPNRLRLAIKHFVKLEERFEYETDDWVNTFGLRLSYEASLTLKFQGDVVEFGKGFYLPVTLKFYWNLIGTKQFNDKLRFMPGLGYSFNKQWKAAFYVGYNYSRNNVGEEFHTNDIIYRLRVYQRFKTKD